MSYGYMFAAGGATIAGPQIMLDRQLRSPKLSCQQKHCLRSFYVCPDLVLQTFFLQLLDLKLQLLFPVSTSLTGVYGRQKLAALLCMLTRAVLMLQVSLLQLVFHTVKQLLVSMLAFNLHHVLR